jgi:DNA-binding response OmpR family regulator
VLDLMLPGLNGYRVCSELRAAEIWTPIIMLTAKDEFSTGRGARHRRRRRDEAVSISRSSPGCARCAAGVVRACGAGGGDLDWTSRRRLARRGQLTSARAGIARIPSSSPGEVCSKTEIIVHVWDVAFEGVVNIVEVYVGHLRAKLDRPFGRHAIETIRGAGYRLAADGG